MDIEDVAHQLYLSLNAMPCRCLYHWTPAGYEPVTRCSRCIAIAAYLEIVPQPAPVGAYSTAPQQEASP